MGRRLAPERKAAFEALEPNQLYTCAHVADHAPFVGSPETVKNARRSFRNNLSGHFAITIGQPDDHILIEGRGQSLYPAWYGKKWKEAAGVE